MDDSVRKKFAPLVLRAVKLLLDPMAAAAVLKRSERHAMRKVQGRNRVR